MTTQGRRQVTLVPKITTIRILRQNAWLKGFRTNSRGVLRGSLTRLLDWYAEREANETKRSAAGDLQVHFIDLAESMMLDAAILPSKVPEALRRNYRRAFMGSLNEQELDAIIEDTMLYLEAGIGDGDDGGQTT